MIKEIALINFIPYVNNMQIIVVYVVEASLRITHRIPLVRQSATRLRKINIPQNYELP